MGYFDALMRYFEIGGRTSRSQYWTYQLIALLAGIAALAADYGALRLNLWTDHIGLFTTFCAIFHVVPGITSTVRRLHDIGKSGFWYLLCLVPFGVIVVLVWTIRRGDEGDNGFGEPEQGASGSAGPAEAYGYEPPTGRVLRLGNQPARSSPPAEGGVSTTRFI